MMAKKKRLLKRFLWVIFAVFLLLNAIAFFHAWKFTHFSNDKGAKTKSGNLPAIAKLKVLAVGVSNPRPVNTTMPGSSFETIVLQSTKRIESWLIRHDSAKGTVILFHGYKGEKSSMLDKADQFLAAGYNTMLVDFMGAGGSEGNQTTVGYREAEQVKSCYEYVRALGEKKIFLFGTSMGAAAILKSINDDRLTPSGIIIECPFSTLYQTTCARFRTLGVPSFPMADLLVFWGGVQNGFWGFSHRPVEYAKSVNCPALMFYGEKDEKVSREETNAIFNNLRGEKILVTFPEAGHENYFNKYKPVWSAAVREFLTKN